MNPVRSWYSSELRERFSLGASPLLGGDLGKEGLSGFLVDVETIKAL